MNNNKVISYLHRRWFLFRELVFERSIQPISCMDYFADYASTSSSDSEPEEKDLQEKLQDFFSEIDSLTGLKKTTTTPTINIDESSSNEDDPNYDVSDKPPCDQHDVEQGVEPADATGTSVTGTAATSLLQVVNNAAEENEYLDEWPVENHLRDTVTYGPSPAPADYVEKAKIETCQKRRRLDSEDNHLNAEYIDTELERPLLETCQEYTDSAVQTMDSIKDTNDKELKISALKLADLCILKIGEMDPDGTNLALQAYIWQIKVRLEDFEAGQLSSRYVFNKLVAMHLVIEEIESSIAPEGWYCSWNSEHKRYCFVHKQTGSISWTHPMSTMVPGSDITEELD